MMNFRERQRQSMSTMKGNGRPTSEGLVMVCQSGSSISAFILVRQTRLCWPFNNLAVR